MDNAKEVLNSKSQASFFACGSNLVIQFSSPTIYINISFLSPSVFSIKCSKCPEESTVYHCTHAWDGLQQLAVVCFLFLFLFFFLFSFLQISHYYYHLEPQSIEVPLKDSIGLSWRFFKHK